MVLKLTISHGQRAFSLVELLLVLAIIAIFAAVAIPGFRSVIRDYALTDAGNRMMGALNQARQTAIAKNQDVEVRFYADNNNKINGISQYDSIVSLIPANSYTGSSAQWLTKPFFLPPGVVFNVNATSASTTYSSLITPGSGATDSPNTVTLDNNITSDPSYPPPAALQGEAYVAFRFRPDGSTDLDPKENPDGTSAYTWWLSLSNVGSAAGSGTPATPANDFVTILIDQTTGRMRLYQPR